MKEVAINYKGLEIISYEKFLNTSDADRIFASALNEIPWETSTIKMYGKEVSIPRLQCWIGDPGCEYAYSGKSLQRYDFFEPLIEIRSLIQNQLGIYFNSVLANLYRNGNDSMGFHADDEPELGNNPVIASLSLGEERPLIFQNKDKAETKTFDQPHGSLMLMKGATQSAWKHGIRKSKKISEPRINFTFRNIITQ
tara:strand:- start:81 stop:668 length:588 start_codon:yes stop_codon:yes gene_type:complete